MLDPGCHTPFSAGRSWVQLQTTIWAFFGWNLHGFHVCKCVSSSIQNIHKSVKILNLGGCDHELSKSGEASAGAAPVKCRRPEWQEKINPRLFWSRAAHMGVEWEWKSKNQCTLSMETRNHQLHPNSIHAGGFIQGFCWILKKVGKWIES